jgi:hypothetical protein
VVILVARGSDEAMVAFVGSLESGGQFHVGAFGCHCDFVFTFN